MAGEIGIYRREGEGLLEGAGGEPFTYDDVEVIATAGAVATMTRPASMSRTNVPKSRGWGTR